MATSPSFSLQVLKNLSQDEEWIRLNHYVRSWHGIESKIRGPFFLSPAGEHSPGAELIETYQKMFVSEKPEREKIQCKYLARRDFLKRKLQIEQGEIMPCQFSEDWLKRLHSTEVTLVFASAFLNSAGSSFGHIFLKLHNPDNVNSLDLIDYGINFAARTENTSGALYAWYGLLGYFPGTFGMAPYHQMIKEYVNLEGRDLWEYKLNLSPQEVERLLFHVLELEGSYFDYYFLDDNCAFQLLKLLEVAKPDLHLAKDSELWEIPLDSVKVAAQTKGLITETHFRPSLRTQFEQQKAQLSRSHTIKDKKIEVMSTEELELMQTYTALLQGEDFKKYQVQQFELSQERAKRGGTATRSETGVVQGENPLASVDSTFLGAGVVSRRGETASKFSFRPAFRSILDEEGKTTWTELKVLEVNALAYGTDRVALDSLTLLSMQNSQEVDAYFQPLSWGLEIGGRRSIFGDSLRFVPTSVVDIGYSLDFDGSHFHRLSGMLEAGLDADSQQMVGGFRLRLLQKWHYRLRTSLESKWNWGASFCTEVQSFKMAFDVAHDWVLRYGWDQYKKVDQQQNIYIEPAIGLEYHFLL